MRCLPVLFLLIAVHLVVAAVYDEITPNEIPYKDPTEDNEDDDDSEEVLIWSEDREFEEIKLRSMKKYIQLSEEIGSDDEADSHMSDDDAFERNEKDSPPKSSQSKSAVRKKRAATCTIKAQPTFNCDAQSKYRTMDGTCNNLKHPEWGMAMGCQQRFLKANYNGTSDFRNSVKGGPLPGARNISLNINTNDSRNELFLNHMSMFFGQIIAHDMQLTPLFLDADGAVLPCCRPELRNDPRCANIYMQKNDPFYGKFNRTCMDFPRSISCESCDEKGRKFLNIATAFQDASFVYGNSLNESRSLRTNDGTGKLISQNTPIGELLPNSSDPQTDQCSFPDQDRICFRAGSVISSNFKELDGTTNRTLSMGEAFMF